MRLWTFQPQSVVNLLRGGETYRCDATMSTYREFDYFMDAYAWMSQQMIVRGIRPPEGATHPVWAWRKWGGRTGVKRMNYAVPDRLITIDVDPARVLLSDEDVWHEFLCSDSERHEQTRLFNVSRSDYVQACLWEIRPEDVVHTESPRWLHNWFGLRR